jgi:hypothetical protein
VAGVDWRIARREQRDDRRLWPLQVKRRSEIAVRSDPFEVLVPGLARIGAQLLLRSPEQQVPGAFDVIGGEGMAVVPFDALRSWNVSSVPSSFHDQSVARSGTIDCRLFWGTSCLYRRRLLKTPIIGISVELVASSRIDMLAGLSRW